MQLSGRSCKRCPTAAAGLFLASVIVYLLTPADQGSPADYIGTRVKPSLQLAIVVTRHGNRSPLYILPSFPYNANDTTYWPYGVKEISKKGRIQMINAGKKIRSMYNGFLNQFYYPKEFNAFGVANSRSLVSAEMFLAGLFPPKGFQVWNKNLLWQPVPISEETNDHTTFPTEGLGSATCQRLQSSEYISIKEFMMSEVGLEMHRVMTDLQFYTGVTLYDVFTFYDIWDSISCAEVEGYPVPGWARKYYPEPMTYIVSNILEAVAIGSEDQIRLLQGLLFQEFMDVMLSKLNGSNPDQKMHYVSGSDFTIIGLRAIMGLSDIESMVVPMGSLLILELHRVYGSAKYYVEVMYIDALSPGLEPVALNIPGCEAPCDWHRLANITAKYYNITDFQKECQNLTYIG